MLRKQINATESLTQTVSKRNEVPIIKGICAYSGCKNSRLKKRSNE